MVGAPRLALKDHGRRRTLKGRCGALRSRVPRSSPASQTLQGQANRGAITNIDAHAASASLGAATGGARRRCSVTAMGTATATTRTEPTASSNKWFPEIKIVASIMNG